MTDYRGSHQEAVAAAKSAAENLQGLVAEIEIKRQEFAAFIEQAEEARSDVQGLVASAVGDTSSEAGRNAWGIIANVADNLDGARHQTAATEDALQGAAVKLNVVVDELRRYGNGF